MVICAGIDAGSRAIKVVLFDLAASRVVGQGMTDQGVEQPRLAEALYDETLSKAGLDRAQIHAVVATGYGRNRVALAQTTITEITCHARGVHHLVPEARSLVEFRVRPGESRFRRYVSHPLSNRVKDDPVAASIVGKHRSGTTAIS